MESSIELSKVGTNNLKDIDVSLPIGKLTVVTGVSGSGKSSLVFDTLFGESYRRYVESLSSFARQYLKALPKPKMETVQNLPPAIAVRQARSGGTSRSTVGTMTEIADLLRVVFTYCSSIVCPHCQITVESDSAESIAAKCLERFAGEGVLILAPLAHLQKMKTKDLRQQFEAQGFSRLLVNGEMVRLNTAKDGVIKTAEIVVDRITVHKDQFRRLAESVGLGLKAGGNQVWIQNESGVRQRFVSYLGCPNCDRRFIEPTLALFSFNHPYGACPHCQGFGFEGAIDWNKVFPDQSKSLVKKGVAPWNFGSHTAMYQEARNAAKIRTIDVNKAFSDYSSAEWQWLKEGDGKRFTGIKGYFAWLETKRHKAHYRIHAARFRKYVICSQCEGGRLNPDALACRVEGINFAELCRNTIDQFHLWLSGLEKMLDVGSFSDRLREGVMGIQEALDELKARVGYLRKVGLGYLGIDRQTRTLSGGEQQRINMARCLGSALTDTLYCLDEPSAGLHVRDSRNLLGVLCELRDQGNTVVVVEHERTLIEGADHLINVGPEAGHRGGKITYQGKPKGTSQEEEFSSVIAMRRTKFNEWIELRGARTHNLKNVDVKIPVGGLTVVCGVSGSGKTSLVQHTLYPILAQALGSPIEGYVAEPVAASVGPKKVLENLDRIIHVSQTALGRSSRSTIATYLGIYDEMRKMLANTEEARALKLKIGDFSFNTKGGRCENCQGLGTIVEDLSFLGEMDVLCPVCDGKRFKDKVLTVRLRGKNLFELLNMTVSEMRELFFDYPHLTRVLDSIIEMGLGYIAAGQGTSSFSGGEAQRLKLLRLMTKTGGLKPSILIFDEPTTGLSDKDVIRLIAQLRLLTQAGHTVVVVEHHLGMIRSADWVIEVGPEAASAGGRLVFQGMISEMSKTVESITARYLC